MTDSQLRGQCSQTYLSVTQNLKSDRPCKPDGSRIYSVSQRIAVHTFCAYSNSDSSHHAQLIVSGVCDPLELLAVFSLGEPLCGRMRKKAVVASCKVLSQHLPAVRVRRTWYSSVAMLVTGNY
jgi:hypothetical protein